MGTKEVTMGQLPLLAAGLGGREGLSSETGKDWEEELP